MPTLLLLIPTLWASPSQEESGADVICDEGNPNLDAFGVPWASIQPGSVADQVRISLASPLSVEASWELIGRADFGGIEMEWEEHLFVLAGSASAETEVRVPRDPRFETSYRNRYLIDVTLIAEARDELGRVIQEVAVPKFFIVQDHDGERILTPDQAEVEAPFGVVGELTGREREVLIFLQGTNPRFLAPIEAELPERPDILLSERDAAWPSTPGPNPLKNTTAAGEQ